MRKIEPETAAACVEKRRPVSMLRWTSFVVAVVLSVTTATPTLHAQVPEPSEAAVANAKKLLLEGRLLRDSGDHAGARLKFRAAHALAPTPITGIELAREAEALGDLIEALQTAQQVVAMPKKSTEKNEHETARTEAQQRIDALEPRVPSLTLKVVGLASDMTPVVTIDGVPVPFEDLAAPRRLNPGKHVVTVRAEHRKDVTKEIVLAEGAREELRIKLDPITHGTHETTAPPVAKPIASEGSSNSTRTLGLVLAGTGVVVMGVGGLVGLSAKSRWSDAACDANNVCATQADLDERDSARGQGNVATALFVVGVVATGVGAVLWLTNPSREPASGQAAQVGRTVPRIGVAGTMLVLGGQF